MQTDTGQRAWLLVTAIAAFLALGLHAWSYLAIPEQGTMARRLRLGYALAGAVLMLPTGMLFAARKWPGLRLGRRGLWLRAHTWLGGLGGLLLLCHAGFAPGTPLTQGLTAVLAAVVLTGLARLALQRLFRPLIAARLPIDVPPGWLPQQGKDNSLWRGAWYGQLPHLCAVLLDQGERAMEGIRRGGAAPGGGNGSGFLAQLEALYRRTIRPFLAEPLPSSPLADGRDAAALFDRLRVLAGHPEVAEQVGRLQRLCDTRRQLADLRRLYRWLDGCRRLHVLLTGLLLVLIGIHVAQAWRS